MIHVNNVILTHYMRAVEEDPKARTGFSYQKGLSDETVRRNAQEELGIPIEEHQVVALRRFLASLFNLGLYARRHSHPSHVLWTNHFLRVHWFLPLRMWP
jgi:hypothetical protein